MVILGLDGLPGAPGIPGRAGEQVRIFFSRLFNLINYEIFN